jgi:hypothetical protein
MGMMLKTRVHTPILETNLLPESMSWTFPANLTG